MYSSKILFDFSMVAIENRKHGDFGRLCIALLVLLGTVDAEDHSIGYTGVR
jgi:hypothetical protein